MKPLDLLASMADVFTHMFTFNTKLPSYHTNADMGWSMFRSMIYVQIVDRYWIQGYQCSADTEMLKALYVLNYLMAKYVEYLCDKGEPTQICGN